MSTEASITIFISYTREDETLCKELEKHLQAMQRQQLIRVWHERSISAGTDWAQQISEHLNSAQIILLLISSDFLASDYRYGFETQLAMERHNNKKALVIPILLRPVDLRGTPIARLQALPSNGKPVTSPYWHDFDEALEDVARGIRSLVEMLLTQSGQELLVHYHGKFMKPHERGSRKTTSLGLTDIRREVFSEGGSRRTCPVCMAPINSAKQYCIDWNEVKKEFQVMIVYDAKCLHPGCPNFDGSHTEEDFVLKGLPLMIAQESSCSCGAKLCLGNYTLQKRENALEFNAIYICKKCSYKQETTFSDLMHIVASVWKNNLWRKAVKVEIGPSGLQIQKAPSKGLPLIVRNIYCTLRKAR